MLAGSEKAGLAQLRADLLAAARGRVLELGAGTGANLAAYPDQVESVTLIEPDPHMARRLRAKIAANPPRFEHELVEIGAERLPFGDHRFDTAVATLVLCTIPIPAGRWPRSPGCCAPTAPCWCSNTSAIRSALAARAGRTGSKGRGVGRRRVSPEP